MHSLFSRRANRTENPQGWAAISTRRESPTPIPTMDVHPSEPDTCDRKAERRLPDGNVLEILPRLHALDASIPIIIMTGHASIELAVQAVKLGAEHFLTKPVDLPTLVVMLERSLENQRNRRKQALDHSPRTRDGIDPFLGTSAVIRTHMQTW